MLASHPLCPSVPFPPCGTPQGGWDAMVHFDAMPGYQGNLSSYFCIWLILVAVVVMWRGSWGRGGLMVGREWLGCMVGEHSKTRGLFPSPVYIPPTCLGRRARELL